MYLDNEEHKYRYFIINAINNEIFKKIHHNMYNNNVHIENITDEQNIDLSYLISQLEI